LWDNITLGFPTGHPFQDANGHYWTASTDETNSSDAWVVSFVPQLGGAGPEDKGHILRIFCVRGGSGVAIPPY